MGKRVENACTVFKTSAIHNDSTLSIVYLSSLQHLWSRVIWMFDAIQRVPFYRTTQSCCELFIAGVIRGNTNRNPTRKGALCGGLPVGIPEVGADQVYEEIMGYRRRRGLGPLSFA